MKENPGYYVAWIGLIIAIIALIMAWSAYEKINTEVDQQNGKIIEEAKEEVEDEVEESQEEVVVVGEEEGSDKEESEE